MPDLDFQVEGAHAVPHAAAPLLALRLHVTQPPRAGGLPPVPVHTVTLRCQIRIEPARRRYDAQEQSRLSELFGEPHRWGQTVRSMLWTHANIVLPAFTDEVTADLPVPCTFDFNVAATKYFDALGNGDVPLSLLFSGTIFYEGETGGLQAAQISWENEATFRLPVSVWRQMMDQYYPNTAWLCLRKDVFDRLNEYKRSRALPTWEQAVEALMAASHERVTP